MIEKSQLLAAYDADLRLDAEAVGATSVDQLGPLKLAIFGAPGEEQTGFVTYRDLNGPGAVSPTVERVRALVDHVVRWWNLHPELTGLEVKTRAHDDAPGLIEALLEHGFEAEEPESVMIGEAAGLAGLVEVPAGVDIREAIGEEQMYAVARMEDAVFESHHADRIVPELLRRQADGENVSLWGAWVDGKPVSGGRIDVVPNSAFAGVWGGATLPEFRGKGIYRALTSARVNSVLPLGVRYIHSDSTEDSRPILERSGLVKVTETTPYVLER